MGPHAMTTGQIFDLQRFSIHDGPGIRTTVFLKGCPLSCAWCHNPESRDPEPEVSIVDGHCVRCGACLEVCPHPLAPEQLPALDRARCVRCGCCAEVCATGARKMVGRSYSAKTLLKEVERDRPFYDESGGGVTFSGGEPLLQAEFLAECLRACRGRRLHTAVDTSGCAPRERLLEAAASTDLFLYDLKLIDDERHRKETGVSADPILDNLRALDAEGASIWVRVPLIPGVTDDDGNLEAIGEFVAGLERTRRVHLLPYHATGAGKHSRLGRSEPNAAYEQPSQQALDAAAQRLAAHGLEVHKGG